MVTAQEEKNKLLEKITSLEGERRTAYRKLQEAIAEAKIAEAKAVEKKGKDDDDTDSEVEIVEKEKGGNIKKRKAKGKAGKEPPAKKPRAAQVSNGSLMKELKKNEVSISLSLPPPPPH